MNPTKKTIPAPNPVTDSDGDSSTLFFNTLSFSYPAKTIQVTFATEPSAGMLRLLPSQVPESITADLDLSLLPRYYYACFHSGQNGSIVPVDLSINPEFARAWCIHQVVEILSPQVDYYWYRYPGWAEFWWGATSLYENETPAGNSEKWKILHRFTLRILHNTETGQPELLIGYNGLVHILKQNLDALVVQGTDSRRFRLAAWRKRIYHWKQLPVPAHYHPNEVFPVLNPGLANELGIVFPPPSCSCRYDTAIMLINAFMQTFCLSEEFLDAVPHNGKFRAVVSGQSGILPGSRRKLLFGQGGKHSDPLEGIRKFGPLRRPEGKHFRCFFIHFRQNNSNAERLHRYLTGREGRERLNLLTCLPISFATENNIIIEPDDEPEVQIEHCLQQINFDPQVIWYAFYITPWPKDEQDAEKRRLYYRIKELLMHRQISVQVVEAGKLNAGFEMAVGTIACALIAKLGGIPWRPEGEWQNDPVAGFSSSRRYDPEGSRYDAAVYFTPGGRFGGATIYPAGDSRSVAGLALSAFRECLEKHPGMQRLVIHFHRPFTNEEMELLKKMLDELRFNYPVVIAAIRRFQSRDLLVFGNPQERIMPPDGTWTYIGDNSYLLNVNGHNQETEQTMPLLIGFSCTRQGYLGEPGVITGLLDQVYGFTRMHWHSAKVPGLPVTLTYPNRLVSFLPWFRNKMLPVHGECVPWFL